MGRPYFVDLPINLLGSLRVVAGMRGGGSYAAVIPLVEVSAVPVRARSTSSSAEFADVFAAHHAEALRLAFLLTGDRYRAEDVVADAFVKLYKRWSAGGIDNVRAYLRRTVVNEVNSKFRRLALERREAAKRSGDDRGARSAEDQLADHELIADALATLSQRQRTAVVLRYFNDLPEREVAEILGVSVGTVKSSVSRGLDRMRHVLEGESPGQRAQRAQGRGSEGESPGQRAQRAQGRGSSGEVS
jgi:RNA polymerase sigma-70 factor (sigma-E family)